MSARASCSQRHFLLRRLMAHGLIPKPLCASDRTGPLFRGLFKAAQQAEPKDWPTVDEWVLSLSSAQASAVLTHLEKVYG